MRDWWLMQVSGTATDKSSLGSPAPAPSPAAGGKPASERITRLPTVSKLPTSTGQTPTATSSTTGGQQYLQGNLTTLYNVKLNGVQIVLFSAKHGLFQQCTN